MKTLIFSGSPRKNGDTMALVKEVIKYLNGEYKIVDAYNCRIQPCVDCRYCWKNDGCCIDDAYTTACRLLHHMNSRNIAPVVYSHNTNIISSEDDIKAMEGSKNLALFFNEEKY